MSKGSTNFAPMIRPLASRHRFPHLGFVRLTLGFVCLTLGCGTTDNGSGATGSGGEAPESGGSGGTSSGGNGGSESSGGGLMGTLEPPTTRPILACSSDSVSYQGTLGGTAVDESLTIERGPIGVGSPVGFDEGVQVVYNVDERARGAILFPAGSQNAGKVWCIDDGLRREEAETGYAYIGHLLGNCPGTPTEDTVYACQDTGLSEFCSEEGSIEVRPLAGTLGGTEIASGSGSSGFESSFGASGALAIRTGDYEMVVFADSVVADGASGPVTGLIYGRMGSAHDGEVYCIDSGTWMKNEDGSESTFVFDGISFVGDCNDAGPTDRLEGCIGF